MKVYIDVTNTYITRLNTGIQRVAKELVLRLYDYSGTQNFIEFVPIVFLDRLRLWKMITRKEWVRLHEGRPEFRHFGLSRPFSDPFRGRFMRKVPGRSIFLDVDSSWHNRLRRGPLFKKLHNIGTDIIRVHYDLVPILFPQFCHRDTVRKYRKHLAASLTYASLFICISRKAEEDLNAFTEELGLVKDFETSVLKLGADFGAKIKRNNETSKAGHHSFNFDPLKEKGTYLLSVGTLEPRKNHALLMDVFERIHHKFPWIKLVFIGKEGWNVGALKQRIREHPLFKKDLFWFNNVDDEHLSAFYEHCALSVVPSFYEGFGLSVIESLVRGKIVLCSTGGSLPEVGGEYADYFEPDNSKALEALLVGYLSSPKKRKEKEETVRGFKAHSWSESAFDLIKILENYASRKNI